MEKLLKDLLEEYHYGKDTISVSTAFLDMFAKEYARLKCKELLEIVAENAEIKVMKKSQFGKSRKWQKVKEGEEIDLFSYEMQSTVDKDSIFNAVDLDSFCS